MRLHLLMLIILVVVLFLLRVWFCRGTASFRWVQLGGPWVRRARANAADALDAADVFLYRDLSAGSLDGWGWRELKVLPVSWYDELARILAKVEDLGVWPSGLLGAYIAMIGQRPLGVLPIVYRVWASARMSQLDGWFKSWVPDSVFSAGGDRGSVEAWYTSALDIEEVLSGATDSHVHLFVADVIKSFDTVDRRILVCLAGFVMPTLSTMLMLGCGLSWLLALVSLGLVTGVFLRVVP